MGGCQSYFIFIFSVFFHYGLIMLGFGNDLNDNRGQNAFLSMSMSMSMSFCFLEWIF